MSTLTRRSSANRVPDYKDYMSFVSAYRNGKKETESNEENQFILPANEPKKIVPEVSGFNGKTCDSYSSFLEKNRNKKFSSVKPPSTTLPPHKEPNKPMKVKTEIFLQINNDKVEVPKKIEVLVTDQELDKPAEDPIAPGQVEARKKMFEGRTQPEKTPASNLPNQKTKILTLKQKLESNSTPKQHIERIHSPNHHKIEPDSQTTNGCKELPPIQITTTDFAHTAQNFHLIEKKNNEFQADISTKERLIGQLNEALKFKNSITVETVEKKTEEVTENVRVVNVPKDSSNPPPPPPMPNGFCQAPKINRITMKPSREKDNISPPFLANIYSNQETEQDRLVIKNQKSSTLERSNPLVRKLAYGAMLDMYGAYHEKANSYVSTLPRQNVRKDNGLQKIIDSIAAQGGLDKLSGRSNPKAENE